MSLAFDEFSRYSFVLVIKITSFHVLMLYMFQYDYWNLDVLQIVHERTKSGFYYYLLLLQVVVEQYVLGNQ